MLRIVLGVLGILVVLAGGLGLFACLTLAQKADDAAERNVAEFLEGER